MALEAKPIQVCVSAASPSASFSFAKKEFGYRLFLNASEMLVQTDLDDLLIWLVSEYFSAAGKDLEISNAIL